MFYYMVFGLNLSIYVFTSDSHRGSLSSVYNMSNTYLLCFQCENVIKLTKGQYFTIFKRICNAYSGFRLEFWSVLFLLNIRYTISRTVYYINCTLGLVNLKLSFQCGHAKKLTEVQYVIVFKIIYNAYSGLRSEFWSEFFFLLNTRYTISITVYYINCIIELMNLKYPFGNNAY